MSNPIPHRIEVHLPVGRLATATAYGGETFQPDEAEWQATGLRGGEVLLVATAIRSDPFACQTFYPGVTAVPDWFPAAPEWFVTELARMESVA